MRILFGLLAVVLGGFACSSSEVHTGVDAGTPDDSDVVIEARSGFAFSPDTVSFPLGEVAILFVENKDSAVHNFVAEGLGLESGDIAPGATTEIVFTPSVATDYAFVCTIPGHAEAGMVGTLTVTPLSAPLSSS